MSEQVSARVSDFPEATGPVLGARISQLRQMIRDLNVPLPEGHGGRKVSLRGINKHGRDSGPIGVRHYVAKDEGDGFWDFVRVRRGLFLSITDVRYKRPVRMRLPAEPLFKIRILISGLLTSADGESLAKGGQAFIHSYSGLSPTEYILEPGDEPVRMVIVHGKRSALLSMALDHQLLSPPFRSIAENGEFPDMLEPINGALGLRKLGVDVLESRDHYFSDVRAYYLAAKCEEILCTAIERLRAQPTLRVGANKITSRDLARLNEARTILASHIATPPTIAELSRLVGVNTTKLKLGFRELFGETMQEFVSRLRLETALALVENSDLTFAEIGYRIGYAHPANFTQAFKRHYGVTPGQARPS